MAPLNLFGKQSPARTIDYLDRREFDRTPVEMPIYLTEVGFDGQQAQPVDGVQPEVLAFTKDVSLRGVGFKHDGPVEADYAVVTFDLLNDEPVSLLLDVRWSNLERGFRYLSGGRFIGIGDRHGIRRAHPRLPGRQSG